MPIYFWRGTSITSLTAHCWKMGQQRPASYHKTAAVRYWTSHRGIIFLSDHRSHFFQGWHWKHLAAQLLWHSFEAVYASPVQHAHTFVNLVSYHIHQPFRVLQQKLVAVLNKCKGLYCYRSAAVPAICRVSLFGVTRALTV